MKTFFKVWAFLIYLSSDGRDRINSEIRDTEVNRKNNTVNIL